MTAVLIQNFRTFLIVLTTLSLAGKPPLLHVGPNYIMGLNIKGSSFRRLLQSLRDPFTITMLAHFALLSALALLVFSAPLNTFGEIGETPTISSRTELVTRSSDTLKAKIKLKALKDIGMTAGMRLKKGSLRVSGSVHLE